jgi:hypothetical protein
MVIRTPDSHGDSERTPESVPDRWIDMLRLMPHVRVEKVVSARERLRKNRLDGERVLGETLDRLVEVLSEDRLG